MSGIGNTCERYKVCHRHPRKCNSLPEGDSENPEVVRIRVMYQNISSRLEILVMMSRNIRSKQSHLARIPRIWINEQATLIRLDGERNVPRIPMQHTCKTLADLPFTRAEALITDRATTSSTTKKEPKRTLQFHNNGN